MTFKLDIHKYPSKVEHGFSGYSDFIFTVSLTTQPALFSPQSHLYTTNSPHTSPKGASETLEGEALLYITFVGQPLSQLLGGAAVGPQLIAMTADCSST